MTEGKEEVKREQMGAIEAVASHFKKELGWIPTTRVVTILRELEAAYPRLLDYCGTPLTTHALAGKLREPFLHLSERLRWNTARFKIAYDTEEQLEAFKEFDTLDRLDATLRELTIEALEDGDFID